ncbi:hypothetical protein ACHAWF_003571 [Thalassiosira exigua]
MTALLLSLWKAAAAVFAKIHPGGDDTSDPFASCGGCHCIVAQGDSCPAVVPRTDYTDLEIETWAGLIASDPFALACDPYDDGGGECGTTPAQDDLGDEAVCAVHFDGPFESDDDCAGATYALATYPSTAAAEAAGGSVTHAGPCRVCSTLQDLAAYVRERDLTSQGTTCGTNSILSFEKGKRCFVDLGLTEHCAAMWTYNAQNTARNCLLECLVGEVLKDVPNNGPAPECLLNDCLQCDEDESGPVFQKIAGRTRRSSGLLSAIVRPCDELAPVEHELCPQTAPLSSELV